METPKAAVDLTNCDREPIHIPGSIQPHGCLLACDISAKSVLRHSLNAPDMLGIEGSLLGRPLDDILGEQLAHDVLNGLARTVEGGKSALLFDEKLPNGRSFDIAVHRFKGSTIVELEPAGDAVAEPLELARAMIGRIRSIENADRLITSTARLIQGMLAYDRVMIYRFEHDGAGKVVAEAKRAHLESFLGQYFPATDIPQQARALYLKNTIRIISDAHFRPIAIEPAIDASGEPLDLSYAHLRSVSPIHCEYLRNMGVGASMSISIIVDDVLWGLIACHHYGPKTLSMAQRVAAEMFGDFFSLHLNALRHERSLKAATAAREALDGFLRHTVGADDINGALREHLPDFATLMECDGVAMWLDGQWSSVGSTPSAEHSPALARFAETVAEGTVWGTHKLANALPGADAFAQHAAGMLVVPLSQRPRDFLYFFRKEVVQTLDWAGNPEKTYETGPLGDRLTPRKSFAIWKETVRHQAAPWTEADRQFAEAMRGSLVQIVLQHSELLADERSKAAVRQKMLNEELNHRVKNILAVIKSLVTQPYDASVTLQAYVDTLRGRIQALAVAHDQVIRGEGGGALADLLAAELSPYRTNTSRVMIHGPEIWLDARAYSVMALVLHELSTNAAKYGALSTEHGVLSVTWIRTSVGACELHWVERSGPAVVVPSRRGFGSVLIDRSIPFDLGGESTVDYKSEGLEGRFVIPSRFVSLRRPVSPPVKPAAVQASIPDALDLVGKDILIVEDQMLIAADLEQMVSNAGMRVSATATSPSEALAFLKANRPHAAILDFNLGDETSAVVADELRRMDIPFVFATGYGDSNRLPEKYEGVGVIHKPYDVSTVITQIKRALAAAR